MRKKISVDQLETGMFLDELCGSWMDHPFWNTRFLITKSNDIARIKKSGIAELWIDTAKGKDVTGAKTEAAVQKSNEENFNRIASTPNPKPPRADLAAEMERAARICADAKQAVTSMFSEARMGKAVDARGAEPLVEEISSSVMRNPGALISLARLKTKDDYTYLHSVAVCGLMVALARQLELDETQVRQAGMAGLMHDLGKAAIPLEVLNKPGTLTDAEFELIKSHPQHGFDMLRGSGGADHITLDVALHHHEKVNGNGYPKGASDKEISLYAKMGAVCDVYDAVTSERPYKAGWYPARALKKMNEWQGHFDPQVFHAFVRSVGIYPVGSLVRLESENLAVVTETHDRSLLTPVVKVFYSAKRRERLMPRLLDLAKTSARDKIVSLEDPKEWNLPELVELWAGPAAPAQ